MNQEHLHASLAMWPTLWTMLKWMKTIRAGITKDGNGLGSWVKMLRNSTLAPVMRTRITVALGHIATLIKLYTERGYGQTALYIRNRHRVGESKTRGHLGYDAALAVLAKVGGKHFLPLLVNLQEALIWGLGQLDAAGIPGKPLSGDTLARASWAREYVPTRMAEEYSIEELEQTIESVRSDIIEETKAMSGNLEGQSLANEVEREPSEIEGEPFTAPQVPAYGERKSKKLYKYIAVLGQGKDYDSATRQRIARMIAVRQDSERSMNMATNTSYHAAALGKLYYALTCFGIAKAIREQIEAKQNH